jgi:hypothetical protein
LLYLKSAGLYENINNKTIKKKKRKSAGLLAGRSSPS